MMAKRNTKYRAVRSKPGIESYKLPSGNLRYRVRYRDVTGRLRSRTYRLIDDAEEFLHESRLAAARGERIKVKAGDQELTFRRFAADVWIPEQKAISSVAGYDRDRSIYNNHIVRQLGKQPIATIDVEDILDWKLEREASGVGTPTITRALSIISLIFQAAMVRQRTTGVRVNPTQAIKKPRAKRNRAVRVYPVEGMELTRRVLGDPTLSTRIGKDKAQLRSQDAMFVSLMFHTGARPGEVQALRWSDIKNKQIIIDKAVKPDGVGETKTGHSRTIPILPFLAVDLGQLQKIQPKGTKHVMATKEDEPWSISDRRNWTQRHFHKALTLAQEIWRDACENDDLPEDRIDELDGMDQSRPYDLGRHAHSTLMLSSGMPLIQLSQIQGHSVRTLSEVYSHEIVSVNGSVTDVNDSIGQARKTISKVLINYKQRKTNQG